jgi:hypothetical protein
MRDIVDRQAVKEELMKSRAGTLLVLLAAVAVVAAVPAQGNSVKRFKTTVKITSVTYSEVPVPHTTVTGHVSSPKGACLPKRTIVIKRAGTGEQVGDPGTTDADGNFTLGYAFQAGEPITATAKKHELSKRKLCKAGVSESEEG